MPQASVRKAMGKCTVAGWMGWWERSVDGLGIGAGVRTDVVCRHGEGDSFLLFLQGVRSAASSCSSIVPSAVLSQDL